MKLNRRQVLASGASMVAASQWPQAGAANKLRTFPAGFLWGAASAGHQVEGNNTNSDTWFLEHLQPTAFAEPSGDACDSLNRWAQDLDIARDLGLNSYRFSLEWARIEPEPGRFSVAMLDHHLRIIDGCRARGLTPIVTFNHFTSPRWFAMRGAWLDRASPDLFARYCERATRHLGDGIGYALTLNEPNLVMILKWIGLPSQVWEAQRAMLIAAAKAAGSAQFFSANVMDPQDYPRVLPQMIAAHRMGRDAIKSVRANLPVGVSLAVTDDQSVGANSRRDAKRAEVYSAWLDAARGDDFIGVQNYERTRIDAKGPLAPPPDARRNTLGSEVWPPSLAGAVRYVHSATGLPVMVTEHGVGTEDDSLRAWLIPNALTELHAAMAENVPVLGYLHWSLLDNFEWIFGYRIKFGLCEVDRATFRRTPKPSAAVFGAIARRNAV